MDPEILTGMVERMIEGVSAPSRLLEDQNLRKDVVCETIAVVLSGRLDGMELKEDAV